MHVKKMWSLGLLLFLWCMVGCTPVLLPEYSYVSSGLKDPMSIERVEAFSSQRAWEHLEALTEIGGRNFGSDGNTRAREYLRSELESMGLEVKTWEVNFGASEEEGSVRSVAKSLAALIPGTESEDRIVLVAPFDSQQFADFEFVGANDGASGAAVLLEMARVLVDRPLPFAIEIILLDAEAPFLILSDEFSEAGMIYEEVGRNGLASRIEEVGTFSFRMMLYLNRVGDSDLKIARDRMSNRIFREQFWEAAKALRLTDAFPPGAEYEDSGIAHPALIRMGFRRIVSIADTVYGGDESPGEYAGTEEDTLEHCSEESLATVGTVSLAALGSISQRLLKIDTFSRMPDAADALVDARKDVEVYKPLPTWDGVSETAADTQEPMPSDAEELSSSDTQEPTSSDGEEAAP